MTTSPGGGEETLFSLTADVAGVLDALQVIDDGMVATGEAVGKLAEAFAGLNYDNTDLDQLGTLISALDDDLAKAGISVTELDTALGAMRDTLGSTAPELDWLAQASLTSEEAFAALKEQTSLLAQEMQVAWSEVDRGVSSMVRIDNAALGLEGAFHDIEAQIAAYEESMLGAGDQTRVLAEAQLQSAAATLTQQQAFAVMDEAEQQAMVAAEELGSTMLGLDENLARLQEAVYAAAERLGVLADAEGQAFAAEEPLVGMTTNWFAATTQLATGLTSLSDALTQTTTLTDDEVVALQGLVEQMMQGTASFDDMIVAGYSEADVLQELIRLLVVGATSFDDLTAAGVRADTINAVLDGLDAHMTLLAASTKAVADGFIIMGEAAVGPEALTIADAQLQNSLLSVDEAAGVALEHILAVDDAAAKGAADQLLLAQGVNSAVIALKAEADAAGASAETLATIGTVAEETGIKVQTLGAEVDAAGAKAQTAGGGFGMSGYMLFMLGTYALSTARAFFTLGSETENAFLIVQEKISASTAQMQDYQSTLDSIGMQWGQTTTDMAAGLDIVTQAQFRGWDATHILDVATQLGIATNNKATDAANLLALSLKAYGEDAASADQNAQAFYEALSNGRQTMQQLYQTLSPVIDDAYSLGIKLDDLTTVEAAFTQTTGDSTLAVRDFQTFMSDLVKFSAMSSAEIVKLGGSFDQTKYAAMDFTAKLADLATVANGNEQAFLKLIGGADNATLAINKLNLSDKQLEINAAALGVSFDPVKYNALDAAGKLLYLMGIVGDSATKFAALTDGTKATNAALANIGSALDAAGAKAAAMGKNFDIAAYNSANLHDKVQMLFSFLGQEGFDKYFGPKVADEILKASGNMNLLGNSADTAAPKLGNVTKRMQELNAQNNTTSADSAKVQQALLGQGGAAQKVASDTDTSTKRMGAAWSQLADAFMTIYGPNITKTLDGLAHGMQEMANDAKKGNVDTTNAFGLTDNQITATAGFFDWLGSTIGTWSDSTRTAIRTWVANVGSSFGTWSDTTRTSIDTWVSTTLASFTSWSNNTRTSIDTWVSTTWASFTSWSNNTRTTIDTWVTNIVGDIGNGLRGLATSMFTWGVDAVQGFINGLLSMAGNVSNAASTLAGNVAQFLHFTKPDVGPLASADTWMPHFGDLLASGLTADIGKLQAASAQAASSVGKGFATSLAQTTADIGKGFATSLAPQGGSASSSPAIALLAQILAVLKQQQSGMAATQGLGSSSVTNMYNNQYNHLSINDLYKAFNTLAGYSVEFGGRGSSSGIGL